MRSHLRRGLLLLLPAAPEDLLRAEGLQTFWTPRSEYAVAVLRSCTIAEAVLLFAYASIIMMPGSTADTCSTEPPVRACTGHGAALGYRVLSR